MSKTLGFPKGVRQLGEGFCGSNAMKHIISYKYGLEIPENSLMKIGCGSQKNGISVKGMERIATKFNLNYSLKRGSSISDLVESVSKENPVILLVQAWPDRKIHDWSNTWDYGHYVVVIGYNQKKDKVTYYDPYDGKKKFLSKEKLNEIWHDRDSENVYMNFGMFFKN